MSQVCDRQNGRSRVEGNRAEESIAVQGRKKALPPMIFRLIVRRLFFLVFVLLGLSLITFTLSHIVPRDPARMIAGPRASPEAVEKIRKEYGLDQPLAQQYFRYVTGLLRFDFGKSLTSRRLVAEDPARYLPATIELALSSMVFAVLFGIPLGILSAVRRNSALDLLGRTISILGLSIPSFWLALILQFFLFAQLGLLPDGQRLPIGVEEPPRVTGLFTVDALLAGDIPLALLALKHLLMPSFVLGLAALAIVTRIVRSGMLEVLGQDYIRTARAKGLRPRTVLLRSRSQECRASSSYCHWLAVWSPHGRCGTGGNYFFLAWYWSVRVPGNSKL